jgi:protocatechuate 3,4-dioxygenase beta subunit
MKTSILSRLASAFVAVLVPFVLAGCGGGGGDAGSSPFGPGNKAPTLTLALSSAGVTANTPVTVTATVRDGNGQPVSGVVVSLSVSRPELSVLNAATVLTDAQGEARAVLSASSSGLTGADDLTASATVGTSALQARAGFSVTGALPTLNASIESTTLSGSRGPVRVSAVLRDAAGRTLAGQIVNFSSVGSKVRLSQVSSLTDAQGVATTTALPADPTIASADTVLASATVAGREVQSPVNVQIVAEPPAPVRVPTLTLAISSPELTALTPTIVIATVRDASGLPVPGVVVRLSTTRVDLASLSATSVLTDGQGVGRLTITPVSNGVTGADDLNASASLGTTALSARVGFNVPGSTATINSGIDSTTIRGSTGPVRLTAQVRNASGQSVAGQVVNFASPAGVLRFNPVSALTDATGLAATSVTPVDATLGVAETIVASTSIDGRTLQSQVSVQVIGEPAVAPRSPTLALAVSASEITAAAPATVTATVRDASGLPVAGVVVALTTARAGLGQLSAPSVLTDANGQGRVTLAAASGGQTGADDILGSATVGSNAVNGRVGFNVTGSVPTLQAVVDTATLRASVGPVRMAAVARNAQGQPVPGQLVTFASTTGAVRIATATALTDATGTASTLVQPVDAASGLADTLVASATVSGRSVQAVVGVQVVSEEPSISLIVTPAQGISAGTPATAQVVVRDAAGALLPNAIVSFSMQGGLGSFSAGSALTAAATGSASVVLRPASATTAGADVVRASVTVGGVTRSAQQTVQFTPAPVATSPSIVLSLSSSTVTPQLPAAISLQLLDGLQQPVPGAVVTLRTNRSSLAAVSTASVLTNAQGQATATLSSLASGQAGADELIATATVGGSSVQSAAGFVVAAAAPTLELALQPDTALRASTNPPATLTATLRDASGQPQAGQLVRFEGVNGLTLLGAPSVVTNGSGQASVTVRPANAQNNAAELLRASATLAGRDLQATKAVDLVRESPSVDLGFTGSSASTLAAPAGVRAIVRDLRGNVVPNTIVRFSTQGGLGAFSVSSVATAADGSASAFVSPVSATTTGADTVVAVATVDGVAVSATQVVQFAASGTGSASLRLALGSTSISSASPATVTATLTDSRGTAVAGQVVTFSVVRALARTSIGTALTNAQGVATTFLSPSNPAGAGADEVTATVVLGGTTLSDTRGFEINATNVTLAFDALTPAGFTLAEYAQTPLTLRLGNVSVGSPVNVTVTSSCLASGKATISPSTFTATTTSVVLLYKDNGCGALQQQDAIQAVVVGSANAATLTMPLSQPGVSSVAFIQAVPDTIYLKGSGLGESSTVTFEVRDAAGNPLRNQRVQVTLLTGSGGLTMEGRPFNTPVALDTDANGRVSARVNAGTVPTPVRILASITLNGGAVVSTVSSNLSVAVGFPSQLNFSLAQGTLNIEGFDRDGTANTYSIIAADRNGNPVPVGTTINFVTEGGTVEPSKQTQLVSGLARAAANFISSSPRPIDGRITVTAYALGEESFLDRNGDNVWVAGEPYQNLGDVFKDRNFDGLFDPSEDELIPLQGGAQSQSCDVTLSASEALLLGVDAGIPSTSATPPLPSNTCDGTWSGPGRVLVRRATETVLSTSAARPLWAGVSGLEASCSRIRLQTGPQLLGSASAPSVRRALVDGDTWYSTNAEGVLSFIIADANPGRPVPNPTSDLSDAANWTVLPRLNPVAAGSIVSASTASRGFTVGLAGGSPVASTTQATAAGVTYSFTDPTVQRGSITLSVKSPSGLEVSYSIDVDRSRLPATACAVDQ